MPTPEPAAWPKHVMLELTNSCDLACRHCHFHGEGVEKGRSIGMMPEDTWRAAITEIAGWGTDIELQPWGMGEPLLHPSLWRAIAAMKQHPQLTVGFYSNGMQWREADFTSAIDLQLDWVCFSVDGLDADQFRHYREGGELDAVVKTIDGLVAERERRGATKPRVRINMVAYPDAATSTEVFVERWRTIADSLTISRFRPIGSREFSPVALKRVPCYQLDSVMAIGWDGTIAMCCEDPHLSHSVGQFPEHSLSATWRGPQMQALREAHNAGDYASHKLCADCDAWSAIYNRPGTADGLNIIEQTAATTYEYTPPTDGGDN